MTRITPPIGAATPAADTLLADIIADEAEAMNRRVRRSDIASFCRIYEIFEDPEHSVLCDCLLIFTYYSFKLDLNLKLSNNGSLQLYANGTATPVSKNTILNGLTHLYRTAHAAAGARAVRPLNGDDLAVLRDFAAGVIRRTIRKMERVHRQHFSSAYADWLTVTES